MKKHGKAKKARSARSGKRAHKARRPARHSKIKSVSRKAARGRSAKSGSRQAARRPSPPVSTQKAADEIPTLEQVTITCANCGRPFKLMKLKGLSLEGTICQRCSLGEMELPESFG